MRTKPFREILRFFGNLFLATYGVTLFVFGVGYALAAAFDPQAYVISYFFLSPTFAVPLVVGFWFGYGFGWRLSRFARRLIVLPPSALLAFALYMNHHTSLPWSQILVQFFGANWRAGESHLQYGSQAMAVAPLAAAFAYGIGATIRTRRRISSGACVSSEHDWKTPACIGLAIVAVVTISILQRMAHKGNELDFYWSAKTGFQKASLTYPPVRRYLPVSRWVKIIVSPIDGLIVLQTKPRIASRLRGVGWEEATGCVGPATVFFLPVVTGLDENGDTSCLPVKVR